MTVIKGFDSPQGVLKANHDCWQAFSKNKVKSFPAAIMHYLRVET